LSGVLDLALLILSIGLVDSLNPSTVVPALYLASGPAPARRALEFAAGVVGVNLVGGIALLYGPGRLAIEALPEPGQRLIHLIEVGVGVAAVIAAAVVWLRRTRVERWSARSAGPGNRAALLSGIVIAAVELPTAVPYFAAIAAVGEARVRVVVAVALLVLFNLAFIAPVLAIALLGRVTGGAATGGIERFRQGILTHLGGVLAVLLLLLGLGLLGVGALGLAG
jgi:cytochrome c biogenesis protein CcdA